MATVLSSASLVVEDFVTGSENGPRVDSDDSALGGESVKLDSCDSEESDEAQREFEQLQHETKLAWRGHRSIAHDCEDWCDIHFASTGDYGEDCYFKFDPKDSRGPRQQLHDELRRVAKLHHQLADALYPRGEKPDDHILSLDEWSLYLDHDMLGLKLSELTCSALDYLHGVYGSSRPKGPEIDDFYEFIEGVYRVPIERERVLPAINADLASVGLAWHFVETGELIQLRTPVEHFATGHEGDSNAAQVERTNLGLPVTITAEGESLEIYIDDPRTDFVAAFNELNEGSMAASIPVAERGSTT